MSEMERLLREAVERKASDLHVTAGLPPQLRMDGILTRLDYETLTPKKTQELVYSLLSQGQIRTFEDKKELDFSFGIKGLSRFRINVFRQRGSVGTAIRVIPWVIPSFEELGLPEIAKEFADRPHGLVLVTGPTGCGKSTTLAAMIDYINQRKKCHIVSIEDPIEYLYKHNKSTINQRELGTDTLSFPEALKHVVRQDPDIILIGEMRDLETIQAALTLAETGHLILATLHTSAATHAISRIVDVFPSYQQTQIRLQLSMVLLGVMVQQLIPNASGRGRSLAVEVMNVTGAIQNLIRENDLPQIYSIILTGKKYGMCTMNHSLCRLVEEEIITWEEAVARTTDLKELKFLMKK